MEISIMGNVKIDEKLYKRFQYYVLRRKGHKKGNVKVCAEEAIELYIKTMRAEALAQNKTEMEDFGSIEEYMAAMQKNTEVKA